MEDSPMPTLSNPRYEAFAQARARGALLDEAYEGAGFVLHKGHPSRLALRKEVADRIAELRAAQTPDEDHSPAALLGALMRIVKAGDGSENPVLVKEARLAILDLVRLGQDQRWARNLDREKITSDYENLGRGRMKEAEADYP